MIGGEVSARKIKRLWIAAPLRTQLISNEASDGR